MNWEKDLENLETTWYLLEKRNLKWKGRLNILKNIFYIEKY